MLSPHCPHDFSIPMFSVTHSASLDLSSKMYPFPSGCPILVPFLISILPPSDLWSQYSHPFAWLTHHTWRLSKDIRILPGFSKFNKAIVFKRLLCNNILLSWRATPVSTQNHQAPCCRMNQHSWLDFLSRYILFSFSSYLLTLLYLVFFAMPCLVESLSSILFLLDLLSC